MLGERSQIGYAVITSVRLLFATKMIIFLIFLFVPFMVSTVYACNGYELMNFNIKKCENMENVIGFDSLTAQISENCELVTSGCVNINKQINRGNISYSVEKKAKIGMPMKVAGRKNVCTLLEKSKENSDVDLVFKMFDVQQSCPIKAGKICGKNVSIAKQKEQLKMMEGDFEGTVKGWTDSGEFCYRFTMSLVKISKGNMHTQRG